MNLILLGYQWFFSNRIRNYHNLHLGETCVIVCNGPSLNSTDLTCLEPSGVKVFGLNKIYLKKPILPIDYLVAVNKLVIRQGVGLSKFIKRPKFFVTIRSFPIYHFLRGAIILQDWRTTKPFSKDLALEINQGGTVTFVALQLAFYMGFQKVILIGCDHNFIQEGKPNSTQTLVTKDLNHFDPNYFKGNKWQLADLEKSEKHYLIAKEWYEQNSREIVDCTVNGKLEVFRKSYLEKELS